MYSKEELFLAISTVLDPEVGFNLVEMGLIFDASCDDDGNAYVKMMLSPMACPMHQLIQQWVKDAVQKMAGIKSVEIDLVWEPVWNISMADEHVKQALNR